MRAGIERDRDREGREPPDKWSESGGGVCLKGKVSEPAR